MTKNGIKNLHYLIAVWSVSYKQNHRYLSKYCVKTFITRKIRSKILIYETHPTRRASTKTNEKCDEVNKKILA